MTTKDAAAVVAHIFTLREKAANEFGGDWSSGIAEIPVVWLRSLRTALEAEGITRADMEGTAAREAAELFRRLR